MDAKRVVFRVIAGAVVAATLTGGSAMMAGAADADRVQAGLASAAPRALSEVLTAEARRMPAATTTATSAALAATNGAPRSAEAVPVASSAGEIDRAARTGPAHCEDWNLAMDYVPRPDRSTADELGFDLVFTNVGAQPCAFDGWPGLVAEDADGAVLTWALASGATSTMAVLPPSGGRAVAEGTALVPASAGCTEATTDRLRAYITSDGAGGGIVDDVRIPVCVDGTWSLWLGPLTALHGAPGQVVPPEDPEPLPAKCQDEQLSLEYVARPDLSVAGASGFELVVTNITDVPCSIWGWPGLVVEAADGTRIGSSWAVGDDLGEPFVLANGDAAFVRGTAPDPAAAGCEAITADHLRAYVTSDGAGPGVVGTAHIPVCADGSTVLEIGAFAAA